MTRHYSRWKYKPKPKRRYGRLSLRSIRKLFREGKFKVELDRIYRWTGREWRQLTVTWEANKGERGGDGYYFVRIYYTGQKGQHKRRSVALHKLLWIVKHGPVPPDHELHHKNGKNHNLPDIDVELLTKADHDALHGYCNDEVPF